MASSSSFPSFLSNMATEKSLAKLNQAAAGDSNKSVQSSKKHVLPFRGASSNELRTGLLLGRDVTGGGVIGSTSRIKQQTNVNSSSSKVSPASSTHTINSGNGTANRVLTLAQAIKPDSYVIRRTDKFRRNSSSLNLWLGRSHLPMLQAKFNSSQDQSSIEDGGSTPLITKLDKYTHEELTEFRQVFNLFDTGKSLLKNL